MDSAHRRGPDHSDRECRSRPILFTYWKILTGPTRLEPFLLAALCLLVAIGFSVEAFAGLTWLLWEHGALGVTASSDLTLWDVEHLLLWNVVDSIPLLDIPRAVTWERPAVTSGMWVSECWSGSESSSLFRSWAWVRSLSRHHSTKRETSFRIPREEWNVLAAEQRWCLESRWDRFVLMVTRGASGLCVVTVVGGIVAVSFAIRLLITIGVEADSSLLREWLNAPAHSSFTIPLIDHEVHPLWLLDVGDVVASVVIVIAVLAAVYFLALGLLLPLAVGAVYWRIAAVLVGCSLVFLICQALAAVGVALVNIGFAEPTAAIASRKEYRTSWVVWVERDEAGFFRGCAVDDRLDVEQPVPRPLDRWTDRFLRLLMVAIVFWPIGLLAGITVEETKLRALAANGKGHDLE